MKTLLLALTLLGAVGFATPALTGGDDLPRFNTHVHCSRVATFGGQFSCDLQKCCLRTEQGAQAYVATVWSSTPAEVRKLCLVRAEFGGKGSYSLLRTCLEREQQFRRVEMALQP